MANQHLMVDDGDAKPALVPQQPREHSNPGKAPKTPSNHHQQQLRRDATQNGTSPLDLVSFLGRNKQYRWLFSGEIVNMTGAWLTYVATLTTAERYGNSSGMLLSFIIILRLVPSTLWCALAGAVADKCNRVRVLMWTCIIDAGIVASLSLVNSSSRLWLLYVLVFLQFSVETFYEPARKAIVPVIVPKADLALATTLDTFCWSITGAVGAALGGYATSLLGTTACFWLDALTYLTAAAFASQLVVAAPGGVCTVGGSGDRVDVGMAGADDGSNVTTPARVYERKPSKPALDVDTAPGNTSIWTMATHAWKDGMHAMAEGWEYMTAVANRDVACLGTIKATGAMCWGITDLLNVKFASDSAYQSLGDTGATMGIIYGCVGTGCFVGPLLFNTITPTAHVPLLRGVAISMSLLLAGYLTMLTARHIGGLIVATLVRAMGSATLWVYATLLLQLRVPNAILGRVMAVEAALYTLTQSTTALTGGLLFDLGGLTMHQVVGINAGLATLATVVWGAYYWREKRLENAPGGRYTAVQMTDMDNDRDDHDDDDKSDNHRIVP